MGITIDKQNYIVIKTSYGYYVDNEGINYPFSVEVNETDGEKKWIDINWDDDSPKNTSDVIVEILDMFS